MNAKKWNILCVDDDPVNLKLLRFMLAPRGFNVVTAQSGEEAIEKIKIEKVDLVLLDIMMPGMDGFETCKQIKENDNYRNIPVIMITALTSKSDRIRGIEVGAEEFLSKPFDQMEVLARINMLLKVKELNDNLHEAHDNIAILIKFGTSIINLYQPSGDNFMFNKDIIFDQLIRRLNDMQEKPGIVLIRTLNNILSHEWNLYESVSGKFVKLPIKIDIKLSLSQTENEGCFFYNQSEMGNKILQPVIQKLEKHDKTVKNIVYYLNDKLSIFAINYGRDVTSHDAAVLNSIIMHILFLTSLSQVKDIGDSAREMEDSVKHIMHSFARTAGGKDDNTGQHIVRVGLYCALLAEKLKMKESFSHDITNQASLHDIGNIRIPHHLLEKPKSFTDEEWKVMRNHPIYGAEIIGDHPHFKLAKSIALTHHERWDGSGYPYGLSGNDIPMEGRIMAVADQYDSLRSGKVYKKSLDHRAACSIMIKGDGRTMPGHFDPMVLNAFAELVPEFEVIYTRFSKETR